MTTVPTYKIRLYVRNKEERSNPAVESKFKIGELDSLFRSFLNELSKGQYEKSKEYLSDLVIKNVSTQQLQGLSANIKFDKKMELYFSGMQFGQQNQQLFFIQYKYSKEKNDPPKELIKVIFDNKNKIASVQPMKR